MLSSFDIEYALETSLCIAQSSLCLISGKDVLDVDSEEARRRNHGTHKKQAFTQSI